MRNYVSFWSLINKIRYTCTFVVSYYVHLATYEGKYLKWNRENLTFISFKRKLYINLYKYINILTSKIRLIREKKNLPCRATHWCRDLTIFICVIPPSTNYLCSTCSRATPTYLRLVEIIL